MKHPGKVIVGAIGLALVTIALAMPVSADAATAGWSFEPPSWDFGARAPEEGFSEPHPFVLTNTGDVVLEPTLVSLTPGPGESGEFKLRGGGCHVVLGPGESCQIEVAFRAIEAGSATASLEVFEQNSKVPPAVAHLTSFGGEPSVVITPSALDFGVITLPQNAALPRGSSRLLTVANDGSAGLAIKEAEFEEPGTSPVWPNFSDKESSFGSGGCFDGRPYAIVLPGGSCVIEVGFDPRGPGAYQAQFQLFDNAPDSPQTISLSGTAIPEVPTPMVRDTQAPAAPVLTHKPGRRTKGRDAIFAFSPGDQSTARYQCSLGGGPLVTSCRSLVHFRNLNPGRHLFRVRAVGGDLVPGPVVSYRWRILR